MRSIAISPAAWAALAASTEARGLTLVASEPPRSPYGHVYVWLDQRAYKALEAYRRPAEGWSATVLRAIEEENAIDRRDAPDAGPAA
jgi:hypothetical protein